LSHCDHRDLYSFPTRRSSDLRNEYENNQIDQELFVHEKAHITQKHSLDILFIEALQILFWFNPLIYLYKKAMKLNHEFLADQKVDRKSTRLNSSHVKISYAVF